MYYIGRKNDIIKRYGVRINLNQISDNIYKKTSIQNVCVWYENDSQLLLFLLIKGYDNVLKDKIVDKTRVKLLHELPKEHFPDFIEAMPNFPLTSNGKIDKATLINVFLTTTLTLQNRAASHKPIDVFNSLIAKYFGLTETQLTAHENCSFFDIGGNSILIIQFLEEFRKISSREIPNELVTILFENSLERCRTYIVQMEQDLKRTVDVIVEEQEVQSRQKVIKVDYSGEIRGDFEMQVLWKYDLKACVDCSPVVIKNR